MAYLDKDGVKKLWAKVIAKFNKGITDISISDKTVTITKGDGSTSTQTTKDTEYSVFRGATNSADGSNGLVPAPKSGKQDSFLKGDGTWGTPENTKYNVVSKASAGLAPQLPNETSTTKYLRQDGTWAVPPNQTYNKATQSSDGLMAKEDKTKLDGIEAGAQKNVNCFDGIQIGDAFYKAHSIGENISLSAIGGATVSLINPNRVVIGAKEYSVFTNDKEGLVPTAPVNEYNDTYVLTESGWDTMRLSTVQNSGEDVGLTIEPSGDLVTIKAATTSKAGVMSASDKTKLDDLPTGTDISATYAKKTDITNMYVYKGSVADASKLPKTGQQVGWVYNIETASVYGGAGMNVAWDGTKWDPLGEIFTITSITNEELDEICV